MKKDVPRIYKNALNWPLARAFYDHLKNGRIKKKADFYIVSTNKNIHKCLLSSFSHHGIIRVDGHYNYHLQHHIYEDVLTGKKKMCSHCGKIDAGIGLFRGAFVCNECIDFERSKLRGEVKKPEQIKKSEAVLFAGLEKENINFTTRNHFSFIGH